jgi:hypothetical protein
MWRRGGGVNTEKGNALEISPPTTSHGVELSLYKAVSCVLVKYTGGGGVELQQGVGLERISR